MDTEDKVRHLRELQAELGNSRIPDSTFKPKSTNQELKELSSGVLVLLSLIQYVYFGVQGLETESHFPLVAAPVILTILCLAAEKIHPIEKVQAGEHGLASSFNFLTINFLFFILAEAAVAMAMIALVFSFDWRYAVFLGYPVILIEWIKRKNKPNQAAHTTPASAPR
ncbi:hypothetical protein [Pelagicoccus sp. SDUM812003]|uniref:hypothetical protein n=1 Tax=Pelagicoccus sp. SDUM812003 TaxID=3041267 RepID=UPI002810883B|nr:hypothetical protein [Pelagicoccus sp. SDUM812003]MDQ8205742.1 hypothetical protein [Pelagicoccus sp. SDUM812003]